LNQEIALLTGHVTRRMQDDSFAATESQRERGKSQDSKTTQWRTARPMGTDGLYIGG
jgi:hypothetical protein